MEDTCSEVLYYPNFNPRDLNGIKQSLLLYDQVNVISPTMTPFTGSILSDGEVADLSRIENTGAVTEEQIWQIPTLKIIPDGEIVNARRDEFMAALEEDLHDQEVLNWEAQWKKDHGGRDLAWFVLPHYEHFRHSSNLSQHSGQYPLPCPVLKPVYGFYLSS